MQGEVANELNTDVWIPIIATLVGGCLSLVGSFGATWLANNNSRKARIKHNTLLEAQAAYEAFWKLLGAYHTAVNLKRQIDEMFDDALKAGHQDMEPWAKVTELVGDEHDVQKISPSESLFLVRTKNADLHNELHLIQSRLANVVASVAKYNEVRSEMAAFLEANFSDGSLGEGTAFSAEFKGKVGLMAEMRQSRLNNLLGQIMENLENDTQRAWKVLEQYKAAAETEFSKDFPKFAIEKVLD